MSIVTSVHVTLNGEEHEVPAGSTVEDLVRSLELDRRRVAVEVNRKIVAREAYTERSLREGDILEIVHFVGGG
jgi:thiamine biosynthesis protein ThiS